MNYLISVVNPGAMDRVCEIAAALDLPQTVTLLGHGTAVQSMLDLLGIESTEKRVIMTVANPEKTRKSLRKCAGRCISASGTRHHHGCPHQKRGRRKNLGISE